ncbi:P-loop containing nucleoside triphosphate hydrolase protein [Clavulina sp. PMI_390]|nr:P-loop containing nucleoside triphosphate hydrolase protein [Clavulina sp. PMI_390]
MSSSSKNTSQTSKKASAPPSVKGAGTSGPLITATSQQSRFHVDTITTLSKEIDLKQVNISIGDNDLIVDAHLKLKTGIHYSLSGRNGEGKSILLKSIAEKLIPGLPTNMRILLVTQIVDAESTMLDLTITEAVVKADTRREAAAWEYQTLSEAINNASPRKISFALANVLLSRAKEELREAQKLASRRSGARGADARKALLVAEAKEVEAQARVDRTKSGEAGATDAADAAAMLVEVENTLDVLGASTAEARARTILLGLGFTTEQLDAKVSTLSGGWRSRCSLAAALLQTPDLLILDEPTNYLDVLSVIWLQEYLNQFDTTLLVVAHDRDFIDNITQELIILRHRTLTYFDGNLSEYERNMLEERKAKIKMKDALDKKKDAMVKTIESARKTAKKTGNDNLAKMAKSRQNKLDDRMGLERSAKGTRFKLNRDFGGYALTSRADIEIDYGDKPIQLVIMSPEAMRFPGALISASNISFSYAKGPNATPVLQDVSITIHPGSRTALVGRNGEGKSTLMKLLIGELTPSKGTIERHSRLRMGYFDQHTVEKLSATEVAKMSPLEHFIETFKTQHGVELNEHTIRGVLGSFGLGGRRSTDPIGTLSGGQKVRLALAVIVYATPDLLVLDEPSTHLDIDTIAALIRALKHYTGAVLLVSHDRHLVRCVVEGASIIPPSVDDDGEVQEYSDGDDEEDGEAGRDPGKVYMVGPKGRVKLLEKGVDGYSESMEKKMKKLKLLSKVIALC